MSGKPFRLLVPCLWCRGLRRCHCHQPPQSGIDSIVVPVSTRGSCRLGLTATSSGSTDARSDCHSSSRRLKHPSIGNQIPELLPTEYPRLTDTSQCYLTTTRPIYAEFTLISTKYATMAHILECLFPLSRAPCGNERRLFCTHLH